MLKNRGPWDVGNEQKADEQDKREKWNMYFGHIKRHPIKNHTGGKQRKVNKS